MISKEAFKLIVISTSLKTGLNQEELALGMGYGKNYISDILSPTGKLTDKFINAFQVQYNSENTKIDPPKELPWQIIDRLSKGIENITRANLLLAEKINSGGSGSAPLSDQEGQKGSGPDPLDVNLSGRKKTIGIKPKKVKPKGILKTVSK